MDKIKQEDIEDICFNVSRNIILPKFKNLSDDDIKNIYIKEDIDHNKYETILSSITILNRELITLG